MKNILKNLSYPKWNKIHSEFGEIIIQTSKELENFDSLYEKLFSGWLAGYPWAYFETLFIDKNTWNSELIEAFQKSKFIKGQECAFITQAFFLWILERLIKNNNKYSEFNIKEIEKQITEKISHGMQLIDFLNIFRDKNSKFIDSSDWLFNYINEVLLLLNEKETKDTLINSLEQNMFLRLEMTLYFTQLIVDINSKVEEKK